MKMNLIFSTRHLPQHLFEDERDTDWGGVDRGAWILLEEGIRPVFSIGDFDSVTQAELEKMQTALNIVPLNPEKDDTDLALAVDEAVSRGYTEIDIYGATGGRLDHFLGALQILYVQSYIDLNIQIRLIDHCNEMRCLTEGVTEVTYDARYPYISFVPAIHPVEIALHGFKYALPRTQLKQGSTRTISNALESETSIGTVTVSEGLVLMVRSVDADI